MDVELERMLVRLDGDARGYTRMLADAQAQAVGFAGIVTQALGAAGLGAVLGTALGQFGEAESIGLRLNAILEAQGQDVQALTEQYRAHAEAMEHLTMMEDDHRLSLLAMTASYGLFGEVAQDAVRNAEALVAIFGGTEEAYLRFTQAMAKGDLETAMRFKRMIGPLREVRDEAELVEKANKLFEAGMRAAEAQAQSFSGQIQRMHRDFGNLTEDLGAFVAEALKPLVDGLSDAIRWFRDLDDVVKRNVVLMAGALTGFLAIGPVLKMLAFLGVSVFNPMLLVVGALGSAMAVFVERSGGITKAIENAKDAVRSFVESNREMIKTVAIAAGVIGGLITVFKLLQVTHVTTIALWAAHAVGVVAWTAVVVAAKVAVAALSLVLTPLGILFAAVMVPVLGAAAVGVVALYRAFRDLASVFSSSNFSLGSFGRVLSAFNEWGRVIRDVATAATSSFDLAWRMVVAGANLAVAQIKELWPPAWNAFKEAAGVVFNFVWEAFKLHAKAAFEYAAGAWEIMMSGGGSDDALVERVQRDLARALRVLSNEFQVDMTDALERAAAGPEGAAVRAARAALEPLRAELRALQDQARADNPLAQAGNSAASAFAGASEQVKKTKEEVNKLQAAASGSVEAAARLGAYIAGATEGAGGPARGPVALGPVARGLSPFGLGGPGAVADVITPLFTQMRDFLRQIAEERGIELVGVGDDS